MADAAHITVQVKLDDHITPENMAALFAAWDSDKQAAFLNELLPSLTEACGSTSAAMRQLSYVLDDLNENWTKLSRQLDPETEGTVGVPPPSFEYYEGAAIGQLDWTLKACDKIHIKNVNLGEVRGFVQKAEDTKLMNRDHEILKWLDAKNILVFPGHIIAEVRLRGNQAIRPWLIGEEFIRDGIKIGTVRSDSANGWVSVVLHEDFLSDATYAAITKRGFVQEAIAKSGGVVLRKHRPWELSDNDPNSVGQLPACDCGAEPGAYHLDQCARAGHNKAVREFLQGPQRSAKLCDECRGTGFYTGLHKTEPCSRGCKPS